MKHHTLPIQAHRSWSCMPPAAPAMHEQTHSNSQRGSRGISLSWGEEALALGPGTYSLWPKLTQTLSPWVFKGSTNHVSYVSVARNGWGHSNIFTLTAFKRTSPLRGSEAPPPVFLDETNVLDISTCIFSFWTLLSWPWGNLQHKGDLSNEKILHMLL